MTQTGATAGPAVLVVGFVLASFGAGPLVALGVNLVVSSAPPPKAGSAAGVAQTGNEFGYALGIATLGSVGAFVYRSQLTDTIPTGLPAQAVHAARESLAGATAAAGQLPDQLATALLAIAREAFTSGLHAVAAVAALVLAGMVLVARTADRRLPRPDLDLTSPVAFRPRRCWTACVG